MSKVRYTLTVYLDVPVDNDYTAEDYSTTESKRDIERHVIRTLDRSKPFGLPSDCDCEVMTVEQIA